MPVHLRNLYYREHQDLVKKQNEQVKQSQTQESRQFDLELSVIREVFVGNHYSLIL